MRKFGETLILGITAIVLFSASNALANERYQRVKDAIQQMVDAGTYGPDDLRIWPGEWNGSPDFIFVWGCSIDISSNFGELEFKYAYIALQVESTALILSKAGYNARLWRPELQAFEEQAVSAAPGISNPYEVLEIFGYTAERLASSLGPSPRTGKYVTADIGGDCGDARFSVRFESEPAGARLWLITEFDFLLCEAKGNDPWSFNACPWYEETVGEVGLPIDSSNYRYVARWPNGSKTSGRRRLMIDLDDDDWENPVVIFKR